MPAASSPLFALFSLFWIFGHLLSGRPATMHNAVRLGNVARVRKEISAHPRQVEARDSQGNTPLHLAALTGQTSLVALLLTKRADVNARNALGFTPLHLAARQNYLAIVRMLLAHGANINARATPSHTILSENTDRPRSGLTPLHIAAERGHRELVEFLIRHGANVNARDSEGDTPLRAAIHQKRFSRQGGTRLYWGPSSANHRLQTLDQVAICLREHGGR